MTTKDELFRRLTDLEDNFTERKLEGANRADLRRTIVAFANSVAEPRSAVLYIGVGNDGRIVGVSNADSLQKMIHEICERGYPPIVPTMEVLSTEGKSVVAVVVTYSGNRPHFSGPAYVRQGSQSIVASEEIFEELVTGRLGKPREILKWKNKVVTVVVRGKELGSAKILGDPRYHVRHECMVMGCTPHYVKLQDIGTDKHISEPLDNVKIAWDETKYRLMLLVEEG